MSSVRSRLGKPVRAETITVTDGEDTFVLSGLPSANNLLNSYDEKVNAGMAALWNAQIANVFDSDSVQQIRLVCQYLQPEEGEARYDPREIAELYAVEGALFVKLLGAAGKIAAGNKDASIIEAEAKN